MTQDDSTTTASGKASSVLSRLSNVSATTLAYNNCGSIVSHSAVHSVYRESIECNLGPGQTLELPPPNKNVHVKYMNNCSEVTIVGSTFIAADRNIVNRGGGNVVTRKADERSSTPGTKSFGRLVKDSILWGYDPQAAMYQTADTSPPAVNPEEPESRSSHSRTRRSPLPWVPHSEAQEHSAEGESGEVSTPPYDVRTGPEPEPVADSAAPSSRQSGHVRPSQLPWSKPALDKGQSMHLDSETGNRFFVSKGSVSTTYDLPASSAANFMLQSGGDSRMLGAVMSQMAQDLNELDWRHVVETGRN